MRYIYLLLITFIFASCGNQKLRFVRTNSTKQKIVEINNIPNLKVKTETAYTPETTKETPEPENATAGTSDVGSDESGEAQTLNIPEVVSSSFPKSVQDSTTVSDEEARSIQNKALRSERLGKTSFTLSLLFFLLALAAFVALITSITGYYSLVGVFVGVGFGVLSFVSLIISIILGSKSLNGAYNTRKGRSRAIAGITISSIVLGLVLFLFVFGLF